MSVSSWPARPTNGTPVRSSSAPGASPTSISRAVGEPVPKTVLVRDRARCGQRSQTATSAASAASRAGRPSGGMGGMANSDSPKNDAAGNTFGTLGAAGAGRGGSSTADFGAGTAGDGAAAGGFGARRGIAAGITGAGMRSRPARPSASRCWRTSRINRDRSSHALSDTFLRPFLGQHGGLGPAGRLRAPGPSRDQPGAPVVGEVRPGPFEYHDEPVPEPDQEKDVDEQPGHPGDPARELDEVQVGDGRRPADRGQRAFVTIMERLPWLTSQAAHDVLGGMFPFLDRGGGHAGDRLAVLH